MPDCPGTPIPGEVYDSNPPIVTYKCSKCGKPLPAPPKEQKPGDLRLRHLRYT